MFKDRLFRNVSHKEIKIYIVIILISAAAFIRSDNDQIISEDGKIRRGEYYERNETVEIVANIEDVGNEEYEIEISPKVLKNDELEEMFSDCYPTLVSKFLNGNASFDSVTGDLAFFDSLDGYPFEISFKSSDREKLSSSGELSADQNGEVTVNCLLTYGDWSKELTFPVKFQIDKDNDIKNDFEILSDEIEKANKETSTQEYLDLPKSIKGHNVTYSDPTHRKNPLILLMGLAALAMVRFASMKDKDGELKKKRELIEQEYPVVLQKMIMYLSSGMNLRNSWIRIYEDSVITKRNNPIYAEINEMINELKTGISEEAAYVNFSQRIALPSITRFTSLLSQNLRKGSTDLTALLSEEARLAFEDRKRRARIKGEEAGTKLLAPMMMLLIVVMVIIMVPAFINI